MQHNDHNCEKYNYMDLPGQASQAGLCTLGKSMKRPKIPKRNQQKQRTTT